MIPVSRLFVVVLVAVVGSSCNERHSDAPTTPLAGTSAASVARPPNKTTPDAGAVCSANRFSLPTIPGWVAQNIADDECRVRDLTPNRDRKGRARIAICVPGDAVADTLVPHAKRKVRVLQANGRDALIRGDIELKRGNVGGEVGIRFLSENGTDWVSVTAFDLAEQDFGVVMDTVVNATADPRPRKPEGRPWEHMDDFSWDEYIAECWHVRDLLSGKNPDVASVPRFERISDALAALLTDKVSSKP